MTSHKKLKRMARQITREEQIAANLQMFEAMALDIDDLQTMAESVGLELEDLLLLNTRVSVSPAPRRIVGKPGRCNSTKDIADYAADRKAEMTWNEIFHEWKGTRPDDSRVKSAATIREAYRRHYGDKAGKRY